MKSSGSDQRDVHGAAGRIFPGLAKSYDRTLNAATIFQDGYWKNWLISRAGLRRGETILDVGCGTGVMEERLEESGLDVVGVDLTVEMLRLAKGKDLSCARDLLAGDAEHLPLSPKSFDVSFSCYVAKYCVPQAFCAELARVLKPGGRLLTYDFARPQGLAGPVLAAYTYGLLPIAGRMLAPVRQGVGYTFRELPRIIRSSDWHGSLPLALAQNRMELVARESLSGGAVQAFVALKEK